MRKRFGTILMGAGLLLIAAALLLVLYNQVEAARAGKAAENAAVELDALIRQRAADGVGSSPEEQLEQSFADKKLIYKRMGTIRLPVEDNPELYYDYIGIISIPELGISLPIMEEWDYDRLKIAPCRYTGSCYANDLVICAHNYDRHFSPIKWIAQGTDVYFTTVDAEVFHYTVLMRETVQPTDIEGMIQQSDDWDLTLFTCNAGGETRCAVRCILAD